MLLTTEKPVIINKPEYKFETVLFLPPNPERRAEGGLRTKGYFKHSYRKGEDSIWYVCDTEGNPVKPAPDEIQKKIQEYLSGFNSVGNIKELPLITVITVVLNGEKYLEQTIQSVINQTYPNVEYIIIDGGSADGTLDIIRKYEDYIDYWASEPDKGIYDAMNKGIRCSLGQWIGFLGSDDVMNYSWLESAFKYLFTNRDKNYIYGDIIFIINNKERYFKYKEIKQNYILKKDFIIPHSGSIANRELFKKNIFDINFRVAGDYAWVLSNLESLNVLYIPQWQIKMRIGGTSSDWKYLKKHYNELKIIEKKFKISISKKRKIKELIKLFISKFPQIYLILQKIFWFFKSILINLKIA